VSLLQRGRGGAARRQGHGGERERHQRDDATEWKITHVDLSFVGPGRSSYAYADTHIGVIPPPVDSVSGDAKLTRSRRDPSLP